MTQRQEYALVTGASSGIGEQFARQLAARGWPLVLVARSGDKLSELRDQLMAAHAIDVRCIPLDLSEPGAPQNLFEQTRSAGLTVTLLVNNAGFGGFGEFAQLDRTRLRQMIDLNVAALVELTHLYLQPMLGLPESERRAGGIINIASVAGFVPFPYSAVYAATKAFVVSFSRSIAEEARQRGVHVLVVNPGTTHTNFFAVAGSNPFGSQPGAQTAAQVAEESLRAFDRGSYSITTGALNRVSLLATALIPNRWIAALVSRAMRERIRSES